MTLYAFLAIGIGAALGTWLRWRFGLWFNPVLPELPLGTDHPAQPGKIKARIISFSGEADPVIPADKVPPSSRKWRMPGRIIE